jgi:hypothetical protein
MSIWKKLFGDRVQTLKRRLPSMAELRRKYNASAEQYLETGYATDVEPIMADLERNIEISEQAIEQSEPGSPDLPTLLANLGMGLSARHNRTPDRERS